MRNPKLLKHTVSVKKVLDFLNEEYPQKDLGKNKLFLASFPKENEFQAWHIMCRDNWIYMSPEFKEYKQAIWEQFPNVKIIFCYFHEISMMVYRKDKERLILR